MSNQCEQLVGLAEKEFGELNSAERTFFESVASDRTADFENCNDIKFSDNRIAIQASRINWLCVNPSARDCIASWGVQVKGAEIEKKLDLRFVTLDFPVAFLNCIFHETITLEYSRLRSLNFSRSQVFGIDAEGIQVDGYVHLDRSFHAQSKVNFSSAKIYGNFLCSGGEFSISSSKLGERSGKALIVENTRIEGSVFLDKGFHARGGLVSFSGTSIGGDLDCQGGKFENPLGKALLAEGGKINRAVLLRNDFSAHGEVNFLGTEVGGDIDCNGGSFLNPNGIALAAQGASIRNNILLSKGFHALGKITLYNAKINNTLCICDANIASDVELDLRSAQAGLIEDEKGSWPESGKLNIDGFIYERIHPHSTIDVQERLEWLRLQPKNRFFPQPYEQLAKALKETGFEEESKEVLIAKHNDLRSRGDLSWFSYLISFVMDFTLAHGYQPQKLLSFVAFFAVLGSCLFGYGYSKNLISPSVVRPFVRESCSLNDEVSELYPSFDPIFYSLDVLIPVIDLHQQRYWLPNVNRGISGICIDDENVCIPYFGHLLRYYFWFQVVIGWALTSILIGGFTGIIRRL